MIVALQQKPEVVDRAAEWLDHFSLIVLLHSSFCLSSSGTGARMITGHDQTLVWWGV